MERRIRQISEFLSSGAFAVLVLLLVLSWTAVMAAILFWPETFSPFAAYAAMLRVWCFGYDPVSGHYNPVQLAMFFIDPLFIGFIAAFIWKGGIISFITGRRRTVTCYAMVSLVAVAAALYGIAYASVGEGEQFSDYTLIRAAEAAPVFSLTDQNGEAYALAPGRITIVSAFYTHCTHTCPQIIEQARRALSKADLPQAVVDTIDVALVTLDPERDSVARLREVAGRLALPPSWHLLTGAADTVNRILDRYQVARVRDDSGNIGHSNIFYVIDREGRLAFRIGLGTAQENWLRRALERLAEEKG